MGTNEFSQALKETLENISTLAYSVLEVTGEPIRQVHEDAISSIILKRIAKLQEHGIATKTKSLEVNEGKSGVDFDLWIGENDSKFIRFTVQAKSFGNNHLPRQKYSIGAEQCDKIISHSKKGPHPSFPLYFLYQYISDSTIHHKNFKFLGGFKQELSSITFSSAYNIRTLIANEELKFSDIHRNKLDGRWKNDIYELFEKKDEKIGLPLYLLYDISPSKVENFNKLISTKNNSAGFFFFFNFSEQFPFKIHNISQKEISKLYGANQPDNDIQVKNLVIINDANKIVRDRNKTITKILGD